MNQLNGLNELESLRLAKCELENARGHVYGLWSKNGDSSSDYIEYQRVCKDCGFVEKISVTSIDSSIENELLCQEKAAKLVNFFVNAEAELLTDENILTFLMCTVDLQSRMDIEKIYSKLIDINKVYEVHNSYPENLIYNAVLSLKRIGQIPEELFKDIHNYLNNTSEYLGKEGISSNARRSM